MNPHEQTPHPDDRLLQRYREANELDAARPGPALREAVLAHARNAAASRAGTVVPAARAAANDSVWTWRALGSLAVIGLVGLLVLQFDRGTPDEQEAALGTGISRPADQPAPAPEATVRAATPADAASASLSEPAAPEPPASATVITTPSRAPVVTEQEPAVRPDAAQRSRLASAAPPIALGQAEEAEHLAEGTAVAPAASADTALRPETPAMAAAPAPAAKAAATRAPMAMAPAAPIATPPAPAPAEAQGGAPAAASRNATEGLARERREATATGPVTTGPLFAAVAAGDLNAVRQGLREGADPNQRNGSGQTPLMAAARRGNEAIVRLLLAAGADRTLRDPQGLSAADHAERAGHSALLPLLQ